MADEARGMEERRPSGATEEDGRISAEPPDPRILAIARAIGRLIARERFKAMTTANGEAEESLGTEPMRREA